MDYKNNREQVTDRLREEVLLGKFEEGETIRETPLATRYKVSRGPVRDALLKLSQEGLLEYIPNCGMKVSSVWSENCIEMMADMRFRIESFAISEIMDGDTDAFLNEVRQNLRLFKLACEDEDIDATVHLDIDFHRLLLSACKQPGLESVWLPLVGRLRLPYSRHTSLRESYDEHDAIVKAIKKGDKKLAINLLKKNIYDPFIKKA